MFVHGRIDSVFACPLQTLGARVEISLVGQWTFGFGFGQGLLTEEEQFTVAVPSANVSPEAWSQLTETEPSTMSLAEVVKLTLAPAGLVASAV